MREYERGTQAVVKTSHISHNLQQFRKLHPGKIIAVVKADAYGHGLVNVVPYLKDCDAFAVATIDEALELRAINQQHRIILLEGVFSAEELAIAIAHDFDVVVHQFQQIELLRDTQRASVDVWAKFDTGMNRLGFQPEIMDQVISQLNEVDAVKQVRLMSHFADSNNKTTSQTQSQLQMNHAIKSKGLEYSFSNTGGILNGLSDADEWARVGIGLYGISPLDSSEAAEFKLKPAMQLYANVIAIKNVPQGSGIGYGATYIAEQDMVIGIVGIGYADGYPWTQQQSHVMIGGHKVAIVGRVSMDMMAIDLTQVTDAAVGQSVELWGDHLPIEHVAAEMGLIPYTLTCGLTKRVKFNVYQ